MNTNNLCNIMIKDFYIEFDCKHAKPTNEQLVDALNKELKKSSQN